MTNLVTFKCTTCGTMYKEADAWSDFFAEPLDSNKVYPADCEDCKAKRLAEEAVDPRVQADLDEMAEKEMQDCILIRKGQ